MHLAYHHRILVTDIFKKHLNSIFRPRGPSKQDGDVSKCIWGVFCSEIVVEMVQTHCTSDGIETFWDLGTCGEVLLPALRGEHIVEKRAQHKHQSKYRKFMEFQ